MMKNNSIVGLIFLLVFANYSIAQEEAEKSELKTEDTVKYYPTLSSMCPDYPTDKCSAYHNFVEIYQPLFTPLRDSTIRFFEIGILRGTSHLMWRDFFSDAEVFGIDIKDYSDVSRKVGVMTVVADQSNRDDLSKFIDTSGGHFDVILDDGGHAMDHQQISLGYLFKHLDPGGMFIIEDVHTSLPEFYPGKEFKVNDHESNTTLLMIELFIRTGKISSAYMSPAEMLYLEQNIERIELHYRTNDRHSIVCVIHKKKEVTP